MKITAINTIKHDRLHISAGDSITVDDEIGKYFVDHGWATADDYKPGTIKGDGPVNITINSVAMGVNNG